MINQSEFIERYYPVASSSREDDILRFLKKLDELIGEKNLNEALKNKKLLCSSFYLQKAGNSISRPHYQKIKEYLLNIFDFVGIVSTVPTREEVIASQDTISYFRGINELLSFIDDVGKDILPDYNPTTDLVRVKSVCVLGWLGLTPDEIADMKVKDLMPIDLNGYKIIGNKGIYEVFGEPFSSLYFLSCLESYKGIPTGKKIVLKGSDEYLFRPTNLGCEKLDGDQIIQIIKRFNMCIRNSMRTPIVFRNLHKNALFLEIYNDKSDTSILNKIMSVMGCTLNYALSYRDQYMKFVDALENNRI